MEGVPGLIEVDKKNGNLKIYKQLYYLAVEDDDAWLFKLNMLK